MAEEVRCSELEFVARVEERSTFVVELVACLEDCGEGEGVIHAVGFRPAA